MTKDYQRLWKDVTNSSGSDEAEAVTTLGEILADKGGRDFVSCLGCKQAKLCTKILDHVSREFCLLPFAVSDDHFRASQSATSNPPRRVFSSSH